jgi:formylglycine-generating enzyme required for sulfatase activity/transcriptional regulator with XRE-family HTH domain
MMMIPDQSGDSNPGVGSRTRISDAEANAIIDGLASIAGEQGISQSEISRKTKISQSTISKLFRNKISRPKYDILQSIAAALGTTITEILGKSFTVPRSYREYLLSLCNFVEPLASTATPITLRLREIYIPLETQGIQTTPDEEILSGDGHPSTRQGIHELSILLGRSADRPCIILGSPGSGKSTFLKHAVLKELDKDHPRLPIYLPLSRFADFLIRHDGQHPALLLEWAEEELRHYGVAKLQARIESGNVVWLLDGLDEIIDTKKMLLVAKIIGGWIKSSLGRQGLLVMTSRPHAVQQPGIPAAVHSSVSRFEILPLGPKLRERFVNTWFLALYGSDGIKRAEQASETLTHALTRHPQLHGMGSNPLMMTMICTIFHQGKRLPERRADLYEQVIEVLLQRRFGPETQKGSEELVRILRYGLMHVARATIERGAVDEIGESEFRSFYKEGIQHLSCASSIDALAIDRQVSDLGSRSGLLTIQGVPGRYRFSHRSFQEFLAARSFSQEPDPYEALGDHLLEDAWREVVLLVAGYLSEVGIAFLADKFLRSILGSGGSVARISLAAEAVAEAPPDVVSSDLSNEVVQCCLRTLGEGASDTEPNELFALGAALGKVGDPRTKVSDENYWVDVASRMDRVRMAKYPVTNTQYLAFENGDGYSNPEFWSKRGWGWRQRWFAGKGQARKDWAGRRFNLPTQPVVSVSYFEAEAYCNWLTDRLGQEGVSWWSDEMKVSIPTREEWALAAYGEDTRTYAWGDSAPEGRANFGNLFERPSPVGIFADGISPQGIADLNGNVWEWCQRRDEQEHDETTGTYGAAWNSTPTDLRSLKGYIVRLDTQSLDTGFRCCIRNANLLINENLSG